MSNYTKTTNFTAKDSLTSGDPNKIIKGFDYDTEFDAIANMSQTKANKIGSATSGNVIKQDGTGDLADSGYAFTELVGNVTVTTAEINKLDGVTATTAELNYLSGVTSAIQTQINTKAATTDIDDLSGVTDAATARTNLGLGALATLDTVDTAEVGDGSITKAKFRDAVGATNFLRASSDAEEGTSSSSPVKLKEFRIPYGGEFYLSFEGRISDGSGGRAQIYKNGVAVGTLHSFSLVSAVQKNEIISGFAAGDLVQLYAYYSGGGGRTTYVKNFRIYESESLIDFEVLS